MDDGTRPSAAAAARPPRGRLDVAGVTRGYRYNELIGTQGGLTALHFAARQGSAAPRARSSMPASTSTCVSPGDQGVAAAGGADQRPLRSRGVPAREGRQSEPAERCRRLAALCRAERAVGADRRLSAAARVPAAVARLSRHDEAAARQGRRSERARPPQGLVLRLQLRSVGRG